MVADMGSNEYESIVKSEDDDRGNHYEAKVSNPTILNGFPL